MRKKSRTGREMDEFVHDMAIKYRYRPIPADDIHGDIRDYYKKNLPDWARKKSSRRRPLYAADGTKVCDSYERVVVGDYGAYIEVSATHIRKSLVCDCEQRNILESAGQARCKQIILLPGESSDCLIRFQLREVDYADYKPGKFYISPYDVYQYPYEA